MTPSANVAVLVCRSALSPSDRNLRAFLDFFGIATRISRHEDGRFLDAVPEGDGAGPYSVLSSAAGLAAVLGLDRAGHGEFPRWLTAAHSVFVYDFDETDASTKLLRFLTGDSRARIGSCDAARSTISVTAASPEICGAMSGLSIRGLPAGRQVVFELGDGRGRPDSLIASGDRDVFVNVSAGGTTTFLSAAAIGPDLGRPVPGNFLDVKDWFCAAVPPVLYLRWAFRDVGWASPEINASLVVDDPLLTARYGFLGYEDLVGLMDRHGFSTTVAFIPWNWRRTRPAVAELFRQHPTELSLAIHGSDHTGDEFGTSSVATLNGKVKTASRRMEGHRRRTGLDHARVMVFPQGVFSVEAARVLKLNGFVAAVNTEVSPVGTTHTEIAELWNTAITKYGTFPIFTRRPITHGLENFAFDAVLGKPCLIVAHHDTFRDGAGELIAAIAGLNRLKPSLRWRPLDDTLRRSFRSRRNADGTIGVEMFGHALRLENPAATAETFLVTKRECDLGHVRRVTHDREPIAWTADGGRMRFHVRVPANGTAAVRVEFTDVLGDRAPAPTISYRAKAGLRRFLSEVRDNHVSTSNLLSWAATTIRHSARVEGGRT